MDDYQRLNRANWDERAPAHAASVDYSVERFLNEPDFVSGVVAYDRPLLGDVSGLRGVHLQCHIGTDTLSLHRLGVRMSGLDFSSESLNQARSLASAVGAEIDYHEADLYDAPEVLGSGGFDLVYTGIGALCWLPSVSRWAEVVAALLKPAGRLFIREGHPVLWSLSEPRPDGVIALEYPYFEREEPSVWDEGGTYVKTDVEFVTTVTHEWNHGMGEIVSALIRAGMDIKGLAEHQSVPWEALPGQMTRDDNGEWQLTDRPWRLPHSYTLQAVKRA